MAPASNRPLDAKLVENDGRVDVLWADMQGGNVNVGPQAEEHSLDGLFTQTIYITSSYTLNPHEVQLLSNGDYLVIGGYNKSGVDLSSNWRRGERDDLGRCYSGGDTWRRGRLDMGRLRSRWHQRSRCALVEYGYVWHGCARYLSYQLSGDRLIRQSPGFAQIYRRGLLHHQPQRINKPGQDHLEVGRHCHTKGCWRNPDHLGRGLLR